MIRITTLIENNIDDNNKLIYEHGLSLLIETENDKFIFDTGQTTDFLKNAYKLNIMLNDLNGVILSHGHYDHTGGVVELLKENNNVKDLYIGKGFFNKKYKKLTDGSYKYNGIKFKKEDIEKLVKIHTINNDIYKLSDDLFLFSNFDICNNYEKLNKNMLLRENDIYKIDEFNDEIALGIITDKGLIIIAGCSHRGLINIVSSIKSKFNMKIRGIIGGTHLINCSKERLNYTLSELEKLNLDFIAVSHCTGSDNIDKLKEFFNKKFIYNNTGNMIVFK